MPVAWGEVPTVWGVFYAEWDQDGLRKLPFPGKFTRAWRHAPILELLSRELTEYFRGERAGFTVPVNLEGPAFFRRVWAELLRIPYGETVTYGELSRRMGNPKASRAVGRALAKNPVPIIVPCHRVVGAKDLGGFGPGLPWKERLLALEATYKEKFSPR